MKSNKVILKKTVESEWIDSNGHVGDISYARIFSQCEVEFLKLMEINAEYKADTSTSVFTVESHITYKRQLHLGDSFEVTVQILDLINKAVHLYFRLTKQDGVECAAYESILVHVAMAREATKSSPFGRYVLANLVHMNLSQRELERPAAGAQLLGIRRNQLD